MVARRDYKKELAYESTPKQKHNRAMRNKARRHALADGRVHKGDGKDVDHIKPLIKGGAATDSNTRVQSASANRSFPRTKRAKMK